MIRIANENDFSVLAELEKAFSKGLNFEEIAKLATDPCFSLILYEEDKKILGHCILYRVLDEANITSFAIRKDFRRQGYGKKFLNELLYELKDQGSNLIYLEVRQQNEAARELYRSCGFEEIGFRKNFYTNPKDNAVLMGIQFKQ